MKQIAAAILTLNLNQPSTFRLRTPLAAKRILLVLLILILLVAEISRVYMVMPYPGSQRNETVQIAYWLNKYAWWIRGIALTISLIALIRVYRMGKTWEKITLTFTLLAYTIVFFLFNYRYEADKIFHKPSVTAFMPVAASADKSKLVIGVDINGEAKAYPIQLIGYHHQVMDTVGNEPIMVTYCTVCRTGRVYSTLVNGRHESFRLVGMDHFNALFEDATTKSWWQQANGEAIAGPLKGARLKEIPSRQLTIGSWMRQYTNSLVMAPDTLYDERYFRLEDYDMGTMQSKLVKRDYRPWQPKSWIVGIKNESASVAYDWNELVRKRVIQDSVQSLPVLLAMEGDTTSFHVFDRRVSGSVLQFDDTVSGDLIIDTTTGSTWNMDGLCIAGPMKGRQLTAVQAYNEFWHSWQRFQHNPKKYIAQK